MEKNTIKIKFFKDKVCVVVGLTVYQASDSDKECIGNVQHIGGSFTLLCVFYSQNVICKLISNIASDLIEYQLSISGNLIIKSIQ